MSELSVRVGVLKLESGLFGLARKQTTQIQNDPAPPVSSHPHYWLVLQVLGPAAGFTFTLPTTNGRGLSRGLCSHWHRNGCTCVDGAVGGFKRHQGLAAKNARQLGDSETITVPRT